MAQARPGLLVPCPSGGSLETAGNCCPREMIAVPSGQARLENRTRLTGLVGDRDRLSTVDLGAAPWLRGLNIAAIVLPEP